MTKTSFKGLTKCEIEDYAHKLETRLNKLRARFETQSKEMQRQALFIQGYKKELKERAQFAASIKETLGVLGLANSEQLALKKIKKIAEFIKLFKDELGASHEAH